MKNAGEFSDEDLYTELENFDKRKLKIDCPTCGRRTAALCSPKTSIVQSGWRWVGLDHREPYATFKSTCIQCLNEYKFTTYTPQ